MKRKIQVKLLSFWRRLQLRAKLVWRRIVKIVKSRRFRKACVISAATTVALLVLVQMFYPADRTLPLAQIDGISISNLSKQEAVARANQAYRNHKLHVYMNDSTKPVVSISLGEIDASVDNADIITKFNYPWYLRLIPTSLFWYGSQFGQPPAPQFGDSSTKAIKETIVARCQVDPVNATLKANGAKLEVVTARPGGKCDQSKIEQAVRAIKPSLQTETAIKVNKVTVQPAITNEAARSLANKLTKHVSAGVTINAKGKKVSLSTQELFTWLDFVVKDNTLLAQVNSERASAWLNREVASLVAVQPGVSKITTRDLTVLSQELGSPGQALDLVATVQKIQSALNGGSTTLDAAVKVVPPREEYTRTYSPSDTGLSALMENYAKDHAGTYGVSMIELDGKRRRAEYNGNKQFVTASTYKLLVAYSLMKRIDSGARSWSSDEACFNKMISQSDNACAESFLNSIGLSAVTSDVNAIGLKNSTFMKSGGPYTTANDQALLLGMIATGQNFSSANQQRLIGAMKANVYRKGIPAGVSGTVADKVGFLDGLLHDSAIVYGPKGTYVLSIMTDGSSWANIADLAKQIDALHSQ